LLRPCEANNLASAVLPPLGLSLLRSSYKCDNRYCNESERGLMFNDLALKIDWSKIDMPILLSDKDKRRPPLAEIDPYKA